MQTPENVKALALRTATPPGQAPLAPELIALARGAGAGLVALLCVWRGQYQIPEPKQILRLCMAAVGIVFIFPICTTFALQSVPASHAATIAAILPLLTALFGLLRRREKAPVGFWASVGCGTLVVVWFLLLRSNGMEPELGDLLIVVACVACAYGYAEGGLLSREIGGWRAICWILVFSAPLAITMLGSYLLWRGGIRQIDSVSAWAGLFYQVLVSQFLGFAFYYRGLALGGVAKMSQVQQFQPVLAVLAASAFLGEHIDVRLWIVLGILLMTVVASRWTLRSRQTGIYGC